MNCINEQVFIIKWAVIVYHISSWYIILCCVCVCVVGYGRTGALQDYHNSLLPWRHGLHPHVWHYQWGVVWSGAGLVRLRSTFISLCVCVRMKSAVCFVEVSHCLLTTNLFPNINVSDSRRMNKNIPFIHSGGKILISTNDKKCKC